MEEFYKHHNVHPPDFIEVFGAPMKQEIENSDLLEEDEECFDVGQFIIEGEMDTTDDDQANEPVSHDEDKNDEITIKEEELPVDDEGEYLFGGAHSDQIDSKPMPSRSLSTSSLRGVNPGLSAVLNSPQLVEEEKAQSPGGSSNLTVVSGQRQRRKSKKLQEWEEYLESSSNSTEPPSPTPPAHTVLPVKSKQSKDPSPQRKQEKKRNNQLGLHIKMAILKEVDKGKLRKGKIASKFNIPNSTLSTIISRRSNIERNYKNQCVALNETSSKVVSSRKQDSLPQEEVEKKMKKKNHLDINMKMAILREVDKGELKKVAIASKFNIPYSTLTTIIYKRTNIERNYKSQYINMLNLIPTNNDLNSNSGSKAKQKQNSVNSDHNSKDSSDENANTSEQCKEQKKLVPTIKVKDKNDLLGEKSQTMKSKSKISALTLSIQKKYKKLNNQSNERIMVKLLNKSIQNKNLDSDKLASKEFTQEPKEDLSNSNNKVNTNCNQKGKLKSQEKKVRSCHRRSFDLATKMCIIEDVDKHKLAKKDVIKKYNIPHSTLSTILLSRSKIKHHFNTLPSNSSSKKLKACYITKPKKIKSKSKVKKNKEHDSTKTPSASSFKPLRQKSKKISKKINGSEDISATKITKTDEHTKTLGSQEAKVPTAPTHCYRRSFDIATKMSVIEDVCKHKLAKKDVAEKHNIRLSTVSTILLSREKIEQYFQLLPSSSQKLIKCHIERYKKSLLKSKVEITQNETNNSKNLSSNASPSMSSDDSNPQKSQTGKENYNKESSTQDVPKEKTTRKIFNLKTKIEIIEEVDKCELSKMEIAKKYNIALSTLCTILSCREKIENNYKLLPSNRKRVRIKNKKVKIVPIDNSNSKIIPNIDTDETDNVLVESNDLDIKLKVNDGSSRKRQSIDLLTKLKILKEVDNKNMNKKAIAKKFNIACSTVSTILFNRSKIEQNSKLCSVTRKKFRRSYNTEIEHKLLSYFSHHKESDIPVSNADLCHKAVSIARELGYKKFKCLPNSSWIWRFKQRFNLKSLGMRGEDKQNIDEAVDKWHSFNDPQHPSNKRVTCDICNCVYYGIDKMRRHVLKQHFL